MLKNGHSLQNSVVLGGFRKHSFAAVISQYLVGNSAIYLSPQAKTNFNLIDEIGASVAIIGIGCSFPENLMASRVSSSIFNKKFTRHKDCTFESEIDLTEVDSLKNVYVIGNHTKKLRLKSSVKILYLNLTSKASELQKQTIEDFEHEANKSKILAYNFRYF